MNETYEVQYAQVAPTPGAESSPDGGGMQFILLMVAMGLLMYALLIRPQQKQQKEQKQMLEKIQKGDQVVTSGGIHGKVTGVTDDILTVEIAQNVRVKLNKSAISSRGGKEGDKA